jgi:hypothetical protein
MIIAYMCHPVAGDVEANLERAKIWLRFLQINNPYVALVAPWITACEVFDDSNTSMRSAGLRRDLTLIRRCDQLWICGVPLARGADADECAFGVGISEGMRMEIDCALANSLVVLHKGEECPGAER